MSILLVEIGLDLVRVPEMAPTTLEHRVRRLPIRDWFNYREGGYKTGGGGGGAYEVLPTKGAGGKSLSHAEGGGGAITCFGVYFTR